MTNPTATRDFLISEVEALENFDFVGIVPSGHPFELVEATRLEDGKLEVRVPGRPPGIPELPVDVRSKLRERGFASKEASDRKEPWVREAADAEEAVKLVQQLHTEVFGHKPDVKLDLGHGSHRIEHEARQKLEVARKRIEGVLKDVLGQPAERDNDGDYVLPIEGVHVMVAPRATLDGRVMVRIFAITNVGINVSPELGILLARLNFGLMIGRFALDVDHRSIWFDETLLGEMFRDEELRFAIDVVAATADEWDDRLKQMFGGVTYQEVLSGRSAEATPPTKPGEGVGMYL